MHPVGHGPIRRLPADIVSMWLGDVIGPLHTIRVCRVIDSLRLGRIVQCAYGP